MLNALTRWIESTGPGAPWVFVALFVAASGLMIWRLEAMTARGLEGTVLGTLIMPYCSGLGNLIFTFLLAQRGGPGREVMTNALVNNLTNMTLLIGVPALVWGMCIVPAQGGKCRKRHQQQRVNRLSLLLTLTAGLFFVGATWALARDGRLNWSDGLVLVGLFLFWQCVHVFDVLKANVRQNKSLSGWLVVDLGLLALGATAIYVSVNWLVNWVSQIPTGFVSAQYLGWLSGWLMVLPNGLLAFYYGWTRRPEVIYTSQVGDGHICIPLCVGLFALHKPLEVPAYFPFGIGLLVGTTLVHFGFVAGLGRLPRFMGAVLLAGYGWFLYHGLPR